MRSLLYFLFIFITANLTAQITNKPAQNVKIEYLGREKYYLNEVIRIQVCVKEEDYILKKNINIEGSLIYPDGKEKIIKFHDNGVAGDLKRKDGIFSTLILDIRKSGRYSLGLKANGINTEGNEFKIVKAISFEVKGYKKLPVEFIPKKLEYRNAQIEVKNAGKIFLKAKERKRIKLLIYPMNLYGRRTKIYAWNIYISPSFLYLKPGETRSVDIYVKPHRYVKPDIYRGYIIIDAIDTVEKVPVMVEILKNKNISLMIHQEKSITWLYIVLGILVICGICIGILLKAKNKYKITGFIIEEEKGKTEYKIGEKEEISIGRSERNDIELLDSSVSRVHAYIRKKGNQYFIIDNESKNGTYLNGEKIKEAKIKTGDVIIIGKYRIKVI